jgi:hypothetical protein
MGILKRETVDFSTLESVELDEEALIEERRKRRRFILEKHKQEPVLPATSQLDENNDQKSDSDECSVSAANYDPSNDRLLEDAKKTSNDAPLPDINDNDEFDMFVAILTLRPQSHLYPRTRRWWLSLYWCRITMIPRAITASCWEKY